MKLRNEFIYQQDKMAALDRVIKIAFDGKWNYYLARIKYICFMQQKQLFKALDELLKKYAFSIVKDEEGKDKLVDFTGTGRWQIKPENKAMWEKESEALMLTEFEVPRISKIPVKVFYSANVPAEEIFLLDEILDSEEE